jgi:hypothetical protein
VFRATATAPLVRETDGVGGCAVEV